MHIKHLLYCLLSISLLSSCTQWKALTTRDNSTAAASTRPAKKSKSKDVRFLDNISVTPGQVVTSKHASGPSMPPLNERKREREMYNSRLRTSVAAGDI